MDTTKATTHVSLCAGYGGIDIGLGRAIANLRTIAFSEIEAFACANLVSKMEAGLLDAAPIWTNLKTFPWADFRDKVDILSGGYPCQPFSAAGKRLGKEDPRHLWPWIADGIRIMRPRICFFENVEGHISLGLREVISELESIGYKTAWGIFSAREVGATHQRKRVFILGVADKHSARLIQRWSITEQAKFHSSMQCGEPAWPSRPSELAYTDSGRQSSSLDSRSGSKEISRGQDYSLAPYGVWPSRPGEQQFAWEPPRVVAHAKSERTGGALAECCGTQGEDATSRGHTDGGSFKLESTGSEGGEILGNAKHDGSHQRSENSRRENVSSEQRRMQESQGGSSSMGDPEGWQDNGRKPGERQYAWEPPRVSRGSMGNRNSKGQRDTEGQGLCGEEGQPNGHALQPTIGSGELGQTQPPMGGNADGPADGLDYAELQVTCDNRTDELRLLGNGVVPATAERAFRTLLAELIP